MTLFCTLCGVALLCTYQQAVRAAVLQLNSGVSPRWFLHHQPHSLVSIPSPVRLTRMPGHALALRRTQSRRQFLPRSRHSPRSPHQIPRLSCNHLPPRCNGLVQQYILDELDQHIPTDRPNDPFEWLLSGTSSSVESLLVPSDVEGLETPMKGGAYGLCFYY